jgi:hypothetical protein
MNEENRKVIFPQFLGVTQWVSYKKQEPLTLRDYEHMSSLPVFGGSVLLIFLVFCVVLNYVS